MLFNSVEFFLFFIIVFGLYLILDHRRQNFLLLVASYIFYGAWDWRFLSLLWISTAIDYFVGQAIYASTDSTKRKRLLALSICANLTILGFFKYFNFFTQSLITLFDYWSIPIHIPTLNIVLPVGISFYTFQTMSYAIDIYYKKLTPAKNILNFALFVAFFPQLVAGPIERATHLLPQVENKRTLSLSNFYEGCYLIFWGLFQKIYVADNMAKIADLVFSNPGPYYATDVLFATYAFAFQIYCDFAGYSNIARGLCKCMGFELMINFNLPYFATNPSEFWSRWHISLSTWLRDYLYIPLGGNRRGTINTYKNLFITMFLGGLWHGAAWTFVLWGAYHGILLIIYRLAEKNRSPKRKHISVIIQSISKTIKIVFFFHLTCLGWLIFRARSLEQVKEMLYSLIFGWTTDFLDHFITNSERLFPYLYILFVVQIIQYKKNDLMAIYNFRPEIKFIFYLACSILLIIWGVTDAQNFIYFQF